MADHAIASSNEEQVRCTYAPTTPAGNPAKLDGPLRVTQVSGDATFTQDPAKPLEIVYKSGTEPSDPTVPAVSEFDVAGDVNNDPAVDKLITLRVTYTVNGAEAGSIGVATSVVEPKTP